MTASDAIVATVAQTRKSPNQIPGKLTIWIANCKAKDTITAAKRDYNEAGKREISNGYSRNGFERVVEGD